MNYTIEEPPRNFDSKFCVEVRAGKFFAKPIDPQLSGFTIKEQNYLPGDIIEYRYPNATLVEREEQYVIGIVRQILYEETTLYLPAFPSTILKIPLTSIIQIPLIPGDRLILKLYTNGSIRVVGHYSSSPEDDTNILLQLYKEGYKALDKDKEKYPIKRGKALYTRHDLVDHRDLFTFTIDPKNSQDFDDAISVDIENSTLYVHIVDIAAESTSSLFYGIEKEYTLTDSEENNLRRRCFTLYLAKTTEHLLDPETASNRLSLIQGVPRGCITVKAKLTDEGLVDSYDIYRSVIIVDKRWNYEEVAEILEHSLAFEHKPLLWLANLTKQRSSTVNYNISLPSIRFDSLDQPFLEESNDPSHTAVATAMILANMIVSKHLSNSGIKLPNRFHDTLRGGELLTKQFSGITGNPTVDSFIQVKRFAKAFYSIDQKGHFGLNITEYVHFTSPMRRYADVIIHRLLAGWIYPQTLLEDEIKVMNKRANLVKSIQTLEKIWKIGRFLIKHNSQDPNLLIDIWITDIKRSGIIWFMPSLSLNGYQHVSTLYPKTRWEFDENTETLQGKQMIISIGKKYQASILTVDPISFGVSLQIIVTP